MTELKQRVVMWMVSAIAGGCAAAPETATVEQFYEECPPSVCGTNAPGFDVYFHSVSKSGRANEAGYRLVGFTKDGVSYQIDVTEGRLTGLRSPLLPRLAGPALVGAVLSFERDGDVKPVRIARVGAMTFPVGDPAPIETYVFEYPTIGAGGWRNLCAAVALAGVADPGPEAFGLQSDEIILFEGDRIDLVAKTVAVEPDPDWFNLGCAGHVLSKLHLTRNTIAANRSVPPAASFASRQTTLKLLTADYCGNGTAFTVAGQRLVWKGELVNYNEPPDTIEAHWNERGAMCLGTPRMAVPTTDEGALAFPDVEAAIAAQCQRPPTCVEYLPDGELRVSGNPAPYY